jgi:hypothetical protein
VQVYIRGIIAFHRFNNVADIKNRLPELEERRLQLFAKSGDFAHPHPVADDIATGVKGSGAGPAARD